MIYRIFNSQSEVDAANLRWVARRNEEGIQDVLCGIKLLDSITTGWDSGRLLNDGRFACQVPDVFAEEFGGYEEKIDDIELVISKEGP